MTKLFFFSLSALLALGAYAESRVTYVYDAAGNCTSRTVVLNSGDAMRNTRSHKAGSTFLNEQVRAKEISISPNPVCSNLRIAISNYSPKSEGEFFLTVLNGEVVASR